MSLIPAFELGVWNAWIFMLIFFIFMFIPDLLNRISRDKLEKGPVTFPKQGKSEKRVNIIWGVVFLLGFIYSFFLPLKLGTMWFYIGLPLNLLGLIIWTVIIMNIFTTPPGKPFTKGLYRYSRHPMYLTQFLMVISVSLAAVSLIFFLFSFVLIVLTVIIAFQEERSCLEHYGDAYREYMNRTPRWIGIPKSGEKR
jgi:protein-S-isoprenylcysteine O-methyltransferase Ste14